MKRESKHNQGYSMVELIIVIAIIGILSALSMITWRSVENAKYEQAVATFRQEATLLRNTTMAQDSRLAMRLYYDTTDGQYYIERGYLTASTPGSFAVPTSSDEIGKLDYFLYRGTSNPVVVLKKGSIRYGAQDIKDMTNGMIIHYVKSDGSMRSEFGSGEAFSFVHRTGDVYGTVRIKADTGLYY